MGYIQLAFIILIAVFIYTVITGAFMRAANYIGELLGFGKLFVFLLQKIRR